jgi:hypothetical protein
MMGGDTKSYGCMLNGTDRSSNGMESLREIRHVY